MSKRRFQKPQSPQEATAKASQPDEVVKNPGDAIAGIAGARLVPRHGRGDTAAG